MTNQATTGDIINLRSRDLKKAKTHFKQGLRSLN